MEEDTPSQGKTNESFILNAIRQCDVLFQRKIQCLKLFLSVLTLVCVLIFGFLNNGENNETVWKNNVLLNRMYNYTLYVLNNKRKKTYFYSL